MPTSQTHEICDEAITSELVGRLAVAFGVSMGTVRAWRHPKESDLNPHGTGKGNPLDQAERFVRIVHERDAGLARQAAYYLVEVVDECDRASGEAPESDEADSDIVHRVRDCIKEGADVPMALVGTHLDAGTLRAARREIAEDVAALHRLDAAVNAELQRQEIRKPCVMASARAVVAGRRLRAAS